MLTEGWDFFCTLFSKAPPTSDTSDLAVKQRSQDNRPDLKVDSIYAALSSLVYVSTTAGNRAQLESHKEDYFTAILEMLCSLRLDHDQNKIWQVQLACWPK